MSKKIFRFLFIFILLTFCPFKVSAMEIFVQSPGEDSISIEVETGDTIEAVKGKIYDKNNKFLIKNQNLYFNNIELTNGRTIGDYEGISNGSIINMTLIVNVLFNANGGVFVDSENYLIENYNDNSDLAFPTREGYVFKGYYTEKTGGFYLDYFDVIENGTTFYAHWDLLGIASLDFTKINNKENLSDVENALIQILMNNGIIISDNVNKLFKNSSGKTIINGNDNGDFILPNDLTEEDNISYTLSTNDKQQLLNYYDSGNIPNIIKLTVLEEEKYKVVFDANDGTFKSGNSLIIDEWENGYETLLPKPTKNGYKFLGYFTEKIGGTKFELILAESGIDKDYTFYAHWELLNEEENPKTFDEIEKKFYIMIASLIILVTSTIYLKKLYLI